MCFARKREFHFKTHDVIDTPSYNRTRKEAELFWKREKRMGNFVIADNSNENERKTEK